MDKAIFSGSLISVLFLLVGTFLFPHSPIMWLAGTTLAYTIFRAIMAAMLLAVLFTTPPRKMLMRLAMGVLAVVLAGWGVGLIMQGSYKLLDIVLFVELGIAFGVAALEVSDEEAEQVVLKGNSHHRPHANAA